MARIADPCLAERRRRQIMDAALACFRRRGFHQSSMQEICAEAGLSAGAVYRYFPSKNDIIAAIAEDDRREAGEAMASVEAGGDLIETLVAWIRGFMADTQTEADAPVFAEVMAEALRDEKLHARLTELWKPMHARLEQLIAAGQKAGRYDPGLDPVRAGRMVRAILEGVRIHSVLVERQDADMVAEDMREMLTRVLKSAPPAGCNSGAEPKMKRAGALEETA